MEITIIVFLVVMLVSSFFYCHCISEDNEKLRKQVAEYFYKEWVRENKTKYRKKIRIINPQLGDQSVIDSKVDKLTKEGYSLYKDGCISGMIVFVKEVEAEEEEKN